MHGRQVEADDAVARGLALLEDLPPGPELAAAVGSAASQRMLARDLPAAIELGERAIGLAAEVGDVEARARANLQTGVARLMHGDVEAGVAQIAAGRDEAEAIGWAAGVGLAHSQLGSGAGEIRRFDLAVPALEECVAWSEARDLGSHHLYATSWLARCELALGRWDDAGARATSLLARPSCVGITRFTALTALGLLRARRGDPAVGEPLDEAATIARETGHLQRLWPVAAARAEAAELEGRAGDEAGLVADALALAEELAYAPAVEELRWWAGGPVPEHAPHTPYGLLLAGRVDDAVASWESIGAPYEAAAARASGDVAARQAAYLALSDLGAAPLAERTAAALRAAGQRVPPRRRPPAADNPFALTRRELDVLVLVADGLTNAEIGDALYISAKTVDHHVSNLLAKLGVATRREAGREARRLGIAAR